MEKNTTPTPSTYVLDLELAQILGRDSPEARSMFGFVELKLRQFNLPSRVEVYEILFEAYLRGRRYLESGATIRNPLAWLRKTAFNVIREYSRQAAKEQSLDSSQIDSLVSKEENLETEELKDDLTNLHKALEVLGQQDPEALRLIHLSNIKGLSWREIRMAFEEESGKVLAEETLRQRAARARKRLRKIFLEIQSSSD